MRERREQLKREIHERHGSLDTMHIYTLSGRDAHERTSHEVHGTDRTRYTRTIGTRETKAVWSRGKRTITGRRDKTRTVVAQTCDQVGHTRRTSDWFTSQMNRVHVLTV